MSSLHRIWPAWLLLAAMPAFADEQAAYDSNGRLASLIAAEDDLAIMTNVIAVLPNGKRIPLQVRRGSSGVVRQGDALEWSARFTLPDGDAGRMHFQSVEDGAGVHYSASLTAESDLDVSAVEFIIDIPRDAFLNGELTADAGPAIRIPDRQPAGLAFYRGPVQALRLRDATGLRTLDIRFDEKRPAALIDRWDADGRSLQLRAVIKSDAWISGTTAGVTATLRATDATPAQPAHLSIDATTSRYRFQGFGGNYCWDNRSPAAAYTLANLKIAWARSAMKLILWDKERNRPGAELQSDFEMMRNLTHKGVPLVISVWTLPERFYTDAYEKPSSSPARVIDPLKWGELLDLITSYLQYAKREYGVEADLFSFNEANIGINIVMTPEAHAAAIERIGAALQAADLKTKMLLGDATGPRDTHRFALQAASDPKARVFVGAVAFHSWGGGTPEQYSAWGDLAQWLNLPLLATEVGVDASAYYTHSWNSYDYGLREARMIQELLTYARPQGLLFWQFTDDYALARAEPGGSVKPSARFWIMKHFTDLIEPSSDALASASDQRDVLFTAFHSGGAYSLQILNTGGARAVTIAGVPDAEWRITQTTENAPYQSEPAIRPQAGVLRLNAPSRSLITLTARVPPSANGSNRAVFPGNSTR